MGDNTHHQDTCDSNHSDQSVVNVTVIPCESSELPRVGEKLETKQRVKTHPLQFCPRSPPLEGTTISSGTCGSTLSSPFDATSFIQIAARSILDDSPSNSHAYFSDDDESSHRYSGDFPSHVPKVNGTHSFKGLQSLSKEVLPTLPDEQDRKRFIGCLAAVLASCYDYDVDADSSTKSQRPDKNYKLDVNDKDCNNDDEFIDYIEDVHYPSHLTSFDEDFGNTDVSDRISNNCGSELFLENLQMPSTESQRIKMLRARLIRESQCAKKAINRHRKRRYDVLSGLLVQSAELLLLDKSHGRCFLPMLSKLLTSAPKKESRTTFGSGAPTFSGIQENGRHDSTTERKSSRLKFLGASRFYNDYDLLFLEQNIDEIEHLRPFIESMSAGSRIRSLSIFLIQHLLHSVNGYDSRIRHPLKILGVVLIMFDFLHDPDLASLNNDVTHSANASDQGVSVLCTQATRVFENLESTIASKLIQLSRNQTSSGQFHQQSSDSKGRNHNMSNLLSRQPRNMSAENTLRGLKIGGTAVAAGALFAITGGLAAPGIAAGLASIVGGTAITAAAASILTSTVAVTAIFGVGGGGLAAYKMQRRTIGLTEFEFIKEDSKDEKNHSDQNKCSLEAELFSTICISGWLRDDCDFQRPWGVNPTRPRIRDRLELLERFYSVYSPEHVSKCSRILSNWKGKEKDLWHILRQKYGRDPTILFPFTTGQRCKYSISHEQTEMVDHLFIELGYVTNATKVVSQLSPFERMLKTRMKPLDHGCVGSSNNGPLPIRVDPELYSTQYTEQGSLFDEISLADSTASENDLSNPSISDEALVNTTNKMPKHLATVWDYQSNFGGELYTVRWESNLLTEICDSVADLAFDVVSGGTAHLLQYTALSTLMSAIAWPYALVHAANIIDASWTLGVERSDEAGKELAKSLLFSSAGNRPVTLVGFSFGARAIYSCLKELANHQEKWEDYQERKLCGEVKKTHRESDTFYSKMREPASIVENVVLMGLPNHLSLSSWRSCRRIVSGRVVHCFSQRDLILSLMFQIKKFVLKPVCGTCRVDVLGVENVDVSDLISGHQDYCLNVGAILKRIRHGEPFQSISTSPHLLYDSDFQSGGGNDTTTG